MRRTGLITVALLALVGVPAHAQEQMIKTDWGTFNFERDLGSMSGLVVGPADSVFKVVKRIFTAIGLPTKDEDPANLSFQVSRLKLVRRLGKKPMAFYMSCGEGILGPNADNWYVFLNYAVQLVPMPGAKARLQMAVSAEAVDIPGGRSDRLPCSTTGQLEYEVLRQIREAFPGTH